MDTTSSKSTKHPSIRATLLICLKYFSTDMTNIAAETKKIQILLADYKNSPVGPPPVAILQRIDALKTSHNKLKERLDIYFVWFDQLTEHGKLKDSILVPKKYNVTEVKGQLQAFFRQWCALRHERKDMEAELLAKNEDYEDNVDAVLVTE